MRERRNGARHVRSSRAGGDARPAAAAPAPAASSPRLAPVSRGRGLDRPAVTAAVASTLTAAMLPAPDVVGLRARAGVGGRRPSPSAGGGRARPCDRVDARRRRARSDRRTARGAGSERPRVERGVARSASSRSRLPLRRRWCQRSRACAVAGIEPRCSAAVAAGLLFLAVHSSSVGPSRSSRPRRRRACRRSAAALALVARGEQRRRGRARISVVRRRRIRRRRRGSRRRS